MSDMEILVLLPFKQENSNSRQNQNIQKLQKTSKFLKNRSKSILNIVFANYSTIELFSDKY